LSINIYNHNKNDFLNSYNARNNFRIFLNYLYSFDRWQYIFSSLKRFKKTFTAFNYLILRWKSTTKIIIMRNIFNVNVVIYTFWTLFIFCRLSPNHYTSFIFKEKIVRIRFINEYSFQWYQFIIVSFFDDFSCFFRLNNVVFHLRNFQEFFSMRMS
jgi:hypothetical protein